MADLFNYTEWLANLKLGDPIYSQSGKAFVIAVVDDEITIERNGNITVFSGKNGRELGKRPGYYGDKALKPWTDEHEAALRTQKKKDDARKARDKAVDKLMIALFGSASSRYCSSSYFSEWPLDKIEKFTKAVEKFNKQEFTPDPE